MIKWLSRLLGFGLFFGATTALAQSESDPRFRVGARLGFAVPFGDLSMAGLRHAAKYQVPVALEAGYLVTPRLLVGVYGQYGVAAPGDYADPNLSVRDIAFGAQAQYHPSTSGRLDPWIGIGSGYEILKFSSAQQQIDVQFRGFEIVKLQGGLDFELARAWALGPFLSYSVGEYTKYSGMIGNGGQNTTFDLTIMGTHEWLTAGVKGTFML